jgi:hypothetical protein
MQVEITYIGRLDDSDDGNNIKYEFVLSVDIGKGINHSPLQLYGKLVSIYKRRNSFFTQRSSG